MSCGSASAIDVIERPESQSVTGNDDEDDSSAAASDSDVGYDSDVDYDSDEFITDVEYDSDDEYDSKYDKILPHLLTAEESSADWNRRLARITRKFKDDGKIANDIRIFYHRSMKDPARRKERKKYHKLLGIAPRRVGDPYSYRKSNSRRRAEKRADVIEYNNRVPFSSENKAAKPRSRVRKFNELEISLTNNKPSSGLESDVLSPPKIRRLHLL